MKRRARPRPKPKPSPPRQHWGPRDVCVQVNRDGHPQTVGFHTLTDAELTEFAFARGERPGQGWQWARAIAMQLAGIPTTMPLSVTVESPRDELMRAAHDNVELRRLLWATHVCDGKHGAPGEMQCHVCLIDFQRHPVEQIEARLSEAPLRWLRTAQWQVCQRCQVQRMTYEASFPCTDGGPHWFVDPAE